MNYSVLLDENNYYNGQHWMSTTELLDGVKVNSFPPENDERLWGAYRYENEKWVLDEIKYQKMLNEKNNSEKIDEILNKLSEIKNRLNELDVKTMKHVDGELSDEEYEPYKQEKIKLRKEYNELEEQL